MQSDFFNSLKSGWRHALCVLTGYTILYLIYFSPVIFAGKILSNGDNFLLYGGLYFMKHTLWSQFITCGYPLFADPQTQHWYPLAWIFHGLIRDWNAYIIIVYILCSCFSYGLIYSITKSRTAAIIGSIIYGMNGWIMSNLEHSGIIHCEIWLPLVLWAYNELRIKFSLVWFAIASIGLGCLILAGQSAVVAFLAMSIAYWVCCFPLLASKNRWKTFGWLALSAIIGLGISMAAVLPALEFSSLGFMRLYMKADDLVSYYNPLQIFNFVFPYLFGGMKDSPYGVAYFGPRDMQTVSCYIGLSIIILAFIAIFSTWRSLETKLWFSFTLLMLLLSLGDNTPFGLLVHYLPVYNHIRVPPRHFNDFSLGMAVLASLGVTAMMAKQVTKQVLTRACFIVVAFVVIMIYPSLLVLDMVQKQFHITGIPAAWINPAIYVPLCITVAQIPILYLFWKKPVCRIRKTMLIALVFVDLASFGWFLPWRYAAMRQSDFSPPAHAAKYIELLKPLNQRILPVRGTRGSADELYPNPSAVWEIPSASCYMNFIPQRNYQLFTMPDGGFILEDWSSPENRALDIAAVRYVFVPKNDPRFPQPQDSSRWKKFDEVGIANIYENMRAAPRAWLVDEVKTMPRDAILKACRKSVIDGAPNFDPMRLALIEEPCAIDNPGSDPEAKVTLNSLEAERVELESDAKTGKFLVLSDTYHPGWKAFVDDKPSKIYITDFNFRGINLPAGKHKIVFVFDPLSLKIGAGISFASLIALSLICIAMRKRERHENAA